MHQTERQQLGQIGERLEQIRDAMARTPLWQRGNQSYQDMAGERQRLLGQQEALNRLRQLQA